MRKREFLLRRQVDSLTVADELEERTELFADFCFHIRLLPVPAATSIVIPAGYLKAGFVYQAQLIFAENFYTSTTDVAQMVGNGFVQGTTAFSMKAAAAGASQPAGLLQNAPVCPLRTNGLCPWTGNAEEGHEASQKAAPSRKPGPVRLLIGAKGLIAESANHTPEGQTKFREGAYQQDSRRARD